MVTPHQTKTLVMGIVGKCRTLANTGMCAKLCVCCACANVAICARIRHVAYLRRRQSLQSVTDIWLWCLNVTDLTRAIRRCYLGVACSILELMAPVRGAARNMLELGTPVRGILRIPLGLVWRCTWSHPASIAGAWDTSTWDSAGATLVSSSKSAPSLSLGVSTPSYL